MKRLDRVLEGIIVLVMIVGMLFFFVVAPLITAWGVATGRIDVVSLEPVQKIGEGDYYEKGN